MFRGFVLLIGGYYKKWLTPTQARELANELLIHADNVERRSKNG